MQGAFPCLPPSHSSLKNRLCWSGRVIQGACPCLPPITVYTQIGSVGAYVSCREHVLAYPPATVHSKIGSVGVDVLYGGHALVYPQPQFTKNRLCWSGRVIQGACPCLRPTTVYTKIGSVGAYVSCREHVLAYPQPQFTKNRLCWRGRVIQGTCPCLPPTTVYSKRGSVEHMCHAGSISLLTPNHSLLKRRLCWSRRVMQGTCPCLPPTTVYKKIGSVGVDVLYREHAFVYPQPQFTHNEALLEQTCHAGIMPVFIPKHSFMTCGGPGASTLVVPGATTIFKKCDGMYCKCTIQIIIILLLLIHVFLNYVYQTVCSILEMFCT